jgi:hypothetical protein
LAVVLVAQVRVGAEDSLVVLAVASQAASLVAVTSVRLRISLKASLAARRVARGALVRHPVTICALT